MESRILQIRITFFMGGRGGGNGRTYHVYLKPIRVDNGRYKLSVGEVEHVPSSNLNARQMELRIIEAERLREIVEGMLEGVVIKISLEIG